MDGINPTPQDPIVFQFIPTSVSLALAETAKRMGMHPDVLAAKVLSNFCARAPKGGNP
jgi:hypothetical protein